MEKCFDVMGCIEPCNAAVRQKYTGRALLITGTAGGENLIDSIVFQQNGITIESMYSCNSFEGEQGFVQTFKQAGGKALPVMIEALNPFGVTVQGNTDSGRVVYTKTIPVSIPATRDAVSEMFIMGLQKGLYGSAAIVLETFGNLPVNDFFGSYSPIRIDPTSVTRNEYENGGAWTFNLVCEEPVPNVVCFMSGLSAALDALNV